MDDSAFVIFIVFGSLWLLMATAAVIALLTDGQKIQLGKTGLIVALPIILPIIITLTYAAVKGTF